MVNEILQKVTEIKDLGVTIDSKMIFKNHIIHKITTKLKKALGFVQRNSKMFTN